MAKIKQCYVDLIKAVSSSSYLLILFFKVRLNETNYIIWFLYFNSHRHTSSLLVFYRLTLKNFMHP